MSKIKVTGSGIRSNNGYGIRLSRTVSGNRRLNSIYLDHVETSGFRMAGITMDAGSHVSVGYNDIRITHSNIYGNGYAGVWMGGCAASGSQGVYCFENVYAGYNLIHDNPGIDIEEQTGNGIFFKDVDGGVIEHCSAYNNGPDSYSSSRRGHLIREATSHQRDHRKGEQPMPYSNVTPEGLRETILHLLRNDDEVKQAILDLIRREGEKHPRRGDR